MWYDWHTEAKTFAERWHGDIGVFIALLCHEGGTAVAKNLKLKAARAEKDMTQAQLAEAVGATRQTVNAIEKGEYNPTIRLCRAICKALGKTLDDLFWEDEG